MYWMNLKTKQSRTGSWSVLSNTNLKVTKLLSGNFPLEMHASKNKTEKLEEQHYFCILKMHDMHKSNTCV